MGMTEAAREVPGWWTATMRECRRATLLDEAVLAVLEAGHTLLDAGCGDTLLLLRRYASRSHSLSEWTW